MQRESTAPLTFILSPKERGKKPAIKTQSLFGERNRRNVQSRIPSPLGGEGRVRGISNCMDTAKGEAKPKA